MTKKCSACSCELQFMKGNCCDFSRGLNWGMTGRLEYVQGKFRALHKVAFQCLSQYMSLSCFTLSCPRPKPFVYRGIVSVQSTSGKHQQKVIPQQRSYMPCYWYSALLEVGVCHPYSSEREKQRNTFYICTFKSLSSWSPWNVYSHYHVTVTSVYLCFRTDLILSCSDNILLFCGCFGWVDVWCGFVSALIHVETAWERPNMHSDFSFCVIPLWFTGAAWGTS